ncbi:CRISPR-associated protein Cas4 [Nanobdella aerobiophila]|uniref:CRISPR-associated exonuclease Cas4 n=1 Tax=Nanobdella aerobiophila TaxID=2586965 RepID=A0A915SYD2_9ARCH|nr:CRISPR-associated protein Cas4 [Nanobdella aerobiophila]BBL45725.1 CRISPR-associated protein Cas4 [Nanobdella aerobiophila]
MKGNYIYYFIICPRKLWFYHHKITMEHESDLVLIGKYIELFYKEKYKYQKKLIIEDISPDIMKRYRDFVLIYEIKKSSSFKEASLWQLKYYLYYLNRKGLNVKGKLIIPEESKEEYIELSKEDEKKIEEMVKNIKEILKSDKPPKVIKKQYCKYCSYRMICWSDEI